MNNQDIANKLIELANELKAEKSIKTDDPFDFDAYEILCNEWDHETTRLDVNGTFTMALCDAQSIGLIDKTLDKVIRNFARCEALTQIWRHADWMYENKVPSTIGNSSGFIVARDVCLEAIVMSNFNGYSFGLPHFHIRKHAQQHLDACRKYYEPLFGMSDD